MRFLTADRGKARPGQLAAQIMRPRFVVCTLRRSTALARPASESHRSSPPSFARTPAAQTPERSRRRRPDCRVARRSRHSVAWPNKNGLPGLTETRQRSICRADLAFKPCAHQIVLADRNAATDDQGHRVASPVVASLQCVRSCRDNVLQRTCTILRPF